MGRNTSKRDEKQTEIFTEEPIIKNLGITKITAKSSGGEVEAVVIAATNVTDIAQLSQEAWQKAAADWLLRLCEGDPTVAKAAIGQAAHQLEAAKLAQE